MPLAAANATIADSISLSDLDLRDRSEYSETCMSKPRFLPEVGLRWGLVLDEAASVSSAADKTLVLAAALAAASMVSPSSAVAFIAASMNWLA
jgi:hypothetical protein